MSFKFFIKLKFFYFFTFGCARSSLLHGLFSSCGELLFSYGEQASHRGGFSLRWLLLWAWTLEHRLSSCGTHTGLSCVAHTQDFPRPGMEPVSPALAGRFFTTESPGKSKGIGVI